MRIFCFIVCFLGLISIIFVNISKAQQVCHEQTPSFLCVANKHCAYIQKFTPESYWLDLVPFMAQSKCVYRDNLRHYLYKGIEKSIDLVNAGVSQVLSLEDDEEMDQGYRLLNSKKDKKILKDLKYFYDDEIALGITRYELGLWLIVIGFFFLRKYLETCGNRKTMFDFMKTQDQGKGQYISEAERQQQLQAKKDSLFIKNEKGQLVELTKEQVRLLREQILKAKKEDSKKESSRLEEVKPATLQFENQEEFLKFIQQTMQKEGKIMINGNYVELNTTPQIEGNAEQITTDQIQSDSSQLATNSQQPQSTTKLLEITKLNSMITESSAQKIEENSKQQLEQQISDEQLIADLEPPKIQNAMSSFKGVNFGMIDALFSMQSNQNDPLFILDDLEIAGFEDTQQTLSSPVKLLNQYDSQMRVKVEMSSLQQSREIPSNTATQDPNENTNIVQKRNGKQGQDEDKNNNKHDSKNQPILKRHHTQEISHSLFIVSQGFNRCRNSIQNANKVESQQQQIAVLRSQLQEKTDEALKLKDTLQRISQQLAKIYSSPQLLSKYIEEKDLLEMLSQGFLSQAKLHLAFLFSSPLIIKYKDDSSGELKQQTIQQIDHNREFNGVIESLKSTGNQIRYRKIPATLDNLRVSLTENPIALHFSGHGIENNKENFGKDSKALKDEGNFLIFEDNEGCAQFMSEKKLFELLEHSGTKLEFVFVASCYSQFAGEIFHNAGAKHVICVRKGFQISDEAAIAFSKNFYHALFSQTVSVCQAFELAKAAMRAEKNKKIAEESRKFIIIKDIDEIANRHSNQNQHNQGITLQDFPDQIMKPKIHKCTTFGPFMKGQVQNVGQEPLFKLETSKVEDFVGRRSEMHEIIMDVIENRFVTIKGMPGIGKTTIAKAIIHFLDERQLFRDGIILLSLRGLDQANMILTRLQLIINKHLPPQEKDDKAIENFSQIQERIIQFMKDKEILLVLDNAEDTLRKEGNQFREILQHLLVCCPQLRLLLTSRYPIGQLADISEKIYTLKELKSQFAIELLMKKAMRPIKENEIEDLLSNPNSGVVFNSNPVQQKKNITRLDEHHICTLLGGHPHAISLAAPLLQDKSLKELYALLNSREIIEWLQIEGIEGPLASLKVSLDTSIKHMTDSEPMAIKLFCLIGLFPGGCTDEDLNYLWRDGWMKLAEKLLRASLLVKKSGSNGEIRYTLFPFMNQYAVQLMDEETKALEHNKACNYLAKICKDLLRMTTQEIVNRLVSLETNIWACIYRIIDKTTITNSEYSNRGKSPASTLRESNLKFSAIDGKSQYSSQGESSDINIDPSQDDYYETFLYQRKNDSRSKSEKHSNKRSLFSENQNNQSQIQNEEVDDDEEETKTQKSSVNQCFTADGVQVTSEEEGSNEKGTNDDEERGNEIQDPQSQIVKKKFNQPSSLMESQIDEDNSHFKTSKKQKKKSQKLVQSSKQQEDENENVYPTQQIAIQLSDDQVSLFLSSHSQNNKIKKKLKIITSDLNKPEKSDNGSLEEEFKSQNTPINFANDNESVGLNRSNSNEFQIGNNALTPISSQNYDWTQSTISQYKNLSKSLINPELSYQRLPNYAHSHVHSLDNIDETFDEDCSQLLTENDRKDVQGYDNEQETSESKVQENMFGQFKHELALNDGSSSDNKQPILLKRLSSKKYQEDKFQPSKYLNIPTLVKEDPQSDQNELGSCIDEKTQNDHESEQQQVIKTKKPNNKRVTIQESHNQSINDPRSIIKGSINNHSSNNQQNQIQISNHNISVVNLTPDGSLLVYYITDLVILRKYDEALKAIEIFALKFTQDNLCIANLLKIQAFVLSETSNDYKLVTQKYEDSNKIFLNLRLAHGQGLCQLAIGFLMYQRPNRFINKKMNESKVFDKAMKKLEDALALYSKVNHCFGEAFCHKILTFIKKKLGVNFIDHQRKYKNTMLRGKEIQEEKRTTFIYLNNSSQQESLFLEVIQQNYDNSYSEQKIGGINLKNTLKDKDTTNLSTSAKRSKNSAQISKNEEIKQQANIQNVKKIQQLSTFVHNIKANEREKEKSKEKQSTARRSKDKDKDIMQKLDIEFDQLKLQLDRSKQENNFDAEEAKDTVSFTSNFQKPILSKNPARVKREAPKTAKFLPQSQTNSLNQSVVSQNKLGPTKSNEQAISMGKPESSSQIQNYLSDNESFQTQHKQSQKEDKKTTVSLKEQAIQQINKYKISKNEQIEKAKNTSQSSYFIQPKNSIHLEDRQSHQYSLKQAGRNNTLQGNSSLFHSQDNSQQPSNTLKRATQKKKGNELFNSTMALNQKIQKNPLFNSDVFFEPCTETVYSDENSDHESTTQNRYSLLSNAPSTLNSNPSQKSQLNVFGRLTERPSIQASNQLTNSISNLHSTNEGKQKQKRASFRKVQNSSDTSNNPVPSTTSKKQHQIQTQNDSGRVSVIDQTRHNSPSIQQKKMVANGNNSSSQTQLNIGSSTTQQVIKNQFMEFSVTTTTTVKIEGKIPQVMVEHQPEIIIEEVDRQE
ncbi:nb-arc domain protein [Stylonychia lemnae]|uniref:Nb-arc domain protein n=1 Tax=Stylonychia lemnae TaxID=5949 RepID=A0A078ARF7_STYLE|nr:nb-arc domain protein [Stylonychia lemnae]|eukprot:CDW83802.1 nb-arc domain protein [Stylonychia lemnae]